MASIMRWLRAARCEGIAKYIFDRRILGLQAYGSKIITGRNHWKQQNQ